MTEDINVRRLQAVEAGRKSETFDPERDISADTWIALDTYCKKIFTSEAFADQWKKPSIAYPLSILRPEHPLLKDKDGKPIELKVHEGAGIQADWGHFLRTKATNAARGIERLPIDPETWNEIDKYIEALRKGNVIYLMSGPLAHAHIIAPSRTTMTFDQEHVMHQHLVDYRSKPVFLERFIQMAAEMRILGLQFPLPTPDEWKKMRETLDSYKEHDWEEYLKIAAAMKILAAEKVLLKNDTLTITMPERKKERDSSLSIPETMEL